MSCEFNNQIYFHTSTNYFYLLAGEGAPQTRDSTQKGSGPGVQGQNQLLPGSYQGLVGEEIGPS